MLRLLPFVLAIFAFAGSAAAESSSCEAGNYLHEGECVPAPQGTYVAVSGAVAATPCAVGTYQPLTGQTSCLEAPAGRYVAEFGAVAATPCAVGTYQPLTGQTSCLEAPVGSFVNFTGASASIDCPAGTTTLEEGSTSQDDCVTDSAPNFEDFCDDANGTLTVVGGVDTCTVAGAAETVETVEVVKRAGVSDRGWTVYLEQEVTKLTIYTFGFGGSDYTVPSFATEYGPVEVTRCFNPGGREFYNLDHKHCQYTPPTE